MPKPPPPDDSTDATGPVQRELHGTEADGNQRYGTGAGGAPASRAGAAAGSLRRPGTP